MSAVRGDSSVDEQSSSIMRRLRRHRRRLHASLILLAVVVGISWWLSGLFDFSRLIDGLHAISTLFAESLPPDFSRWKSWIKPLVDTVSMSIAGTSLAVLLSLPFSFLAARHTSPHPIIFHVARGILNLLRSIPELIMGIVFVAAVGFGTLPGVLALGLHSIGMVAKFFAESIERADSAPIEAARSTGATPFQVVMHGVLPQVLPQFADVSMYRWEYNFRASLVMGMVGAGGIGTELIGSLRILDYRQVSSLLLLILAAVTLVDYLSGHLRKRLS